MKTLYIHIGTPKTGTTSIQKFCKNNSKILEEKGYCFPLFPFQYENVSETRNGHFLVGMIKNQDGERCTEEENKIFYKGMEKVRELFQQFESVILSDEAIWRAMDEEKKELWVELKRIAQEEKFQIKVIVYLRRQDKFVCSLYNQNVKSAVKMSQKSFEEYLGDMNKGVRLDYYSKLERVAAVLGKENVIVRRFESKSFSGGSIYIDFLQAIGLLWSDDFSINQEVRNRSLYGNMHEIKRVLNSIPQTGTDEYVRFFREILWDCSEISEKQYSCNMFSKEETEAFLAQYEEGNQKILQEYLNENGTQLFDASIDDIPKWDSDNIYMREDIIRFIGVSNIYFLDQIRKQKEEMEQIKYKMKHPIRVLFRKISKKVLHR